MIGAYQFWRACFAVIIYLHHCNLCGWGGDAGVVFFFMLSGALLTRNRLLASGPADNCRYYRRRLAVVAPLNVIAIVLCLLLFPELRSLPRRWIAYDLAMVQGWTLDPEIAFSLNSPAWFLGDILFCYALFPLLFRALTARRTLGLTVWAGVFAVYFAVVALWPPCNDLAVFYLFPPMRLPDFMLGMLIGQALARPGFLWPLASRAGPDVLEVGSVALFALFCMGVGLAGGRVALASWWWIPSGALLVVFGAGASEPGFLGRLMRRRVFVVLGGLSSAFYMFQNPVQRAVGEFCNVNGLSPEEWPAVMAGMGVALALAAVYAVVAGLIRRR